MTPTHNSPALDESVSLEKLAELSAEAPTNWRVGPYASDILADNAKGGDTKLFDIRGWGYFTGNGHGALGLSEAEGRRMQQVIGDLATLSVRYVRQQLALASRSERVEGDKPVKAIQESRPVNVREWALRYGSGIASKHLPDASFEATTGLAADIAESLQAVFDMQEQKFAATPKSAIQSEKGGDLHRTARTLHAECSGENIGSASPESPGLAATQPKAAASGDVSLVGTSTLLKQFFNAAFDKGAAGSPSKKEFAAAGKRANKAEAAIYETVRSLVLQARGQGVEEAAKAVEAMWEGNPDPALVLNDASYTTGFDSGCTKSVNSIRALKNTTPASKQVGPHVEFHHHDWLPGFAAFLDDGARLNPESRAFCVLNLGSILATAQAGDVTAAEVPYFIAESMMHEVMHVLEKWAGVEFNEERVEALLEKYRSAMNSATTPARSDAGNEGDAA